MTLQAVIFDVDGTLADTEEAHRQAFNAAFTEFGLSWHWDEALYAELLAVAGGKERLAHYCRRVDPQRLREQDSADFIARLHLRKTSIYEQRVKSGEVPARPGVIRLIQELHSARVRLAIATTTSRANVDVLLASTLAVLPPSTFEVLGCGEQAAAKKPAPDVYQWVLNEMGLDGQDCLAIEDSHNGVRAALSAGIPVLVSECSWTHGNDFTGAVAVLPDLAQVDLAALRRYHSL